MRKWREESGTGQGEVDEPRQVGRVNGKQRETGKREVGMEREGTISGRREDEDGGG